MKITIPNSPPAGQRLMKDILNGKYDSPAIIDFLNFYNDRPLNPKMMAAYLQAIQESADYTIDARGFNKPVIDISGTGGDKKNQVNISTLASFFCAATGLVAVGKYGNKAATSCCGSMDVLEGNQIKIDLSEDQVIKNLRQHNFAPLYARTIYPGAQRVASARKKIKSPTIFNLLFPLARPINGASFIFGVADQSQMTFISKILSSSKSLRCLLVHGRDGSDEISISGTGETEYIFINQGKIKIGVFDCQRLFGITPVDESLLQISNKQAAVEMFRKVCDPFFKSPKLQAIRQAVYANAASALFIGLDQKNSDLSKAAKYKEQLVSTFESGRVLSLLKKLTSLERLR